MSKRGRINPTFQFSGVRGNPPVPEMIRRHPARVAWQMGVLKRYSAALSKMGANIRSQPLGCGRYGCTVKHRRKGFVIKITSDPHEVKFWRFVASVRSKPIPRITPAVKNSLAALGLTPSAGKRLAGFVRLGGPIKPLGGKWFAYVREDVRPLDAMRSKEAHAIQSQVEVAFDGFYYHEGPRANSISKMSAVQFMRAYPRLKSIIQSVGYVRIVHGKQVEDIHVEQVGLRGRTLVLYDARL